jgi:hypothetical protein
MPENPQTQARQEARRILMDLARSIDRRLAIEVRDAGAEGRLHVSLKHGPRQGHIELATQAVLHSEDDAVARNELRLRIKRASDQMQFRPMLNHRLSVKPVPPPSGGRMTGRR